MNAKNNKMMPVLFIGHGSPMNIVEENDFTKSLEEIVKEIPIPKAILVFSAHWVTKGIYITGAQKPEQIYDFYGFPDELYHVIYQTQGAPEVSKTISSQSRKFNIQLSNNRGIDHAAWSVLKHMYPNADIPVLEMSLDYYQSGNYHYELGKSLSYLRDEGILMIGSGNLVHNLGMIQWNADSDPYPWAIAFDKEIKEAILKKDTSKLLEFKSWGRNFDLAHPSYDHYLPLIPVLGLLKENETIHFFHESIQNASISMRSFLIR